MCAIRDLKHTFSTHQIGCKSCDQKYRRSGFDCEILLIANCEFFLNSQSKESQLKEYAMNSIRNHAPSARQALDRSSARACSYFRTYRGTYSLAVEIEVSLRQSTLSQQSALPRPNTKGPGLAILPLDGSNGYGTGNACNLTTSHAFS